MTITTTAGRIGPVRTTPQPLEADQLGGDGHLALRVFEAGLRRIAGTGSQGHDGILTAREASVLIAIYTEQEAQTVRGLAARLDVSKPAITRALDTLSARGLAARSVDPMDRRSVLVRRTLQGSAWVRALDNALAIAAAADPSSRRGG